MSTRTKIPGKNSGKYRIREKQTENGNFNNRKNRHHTFIRHGLDENFQTNYRKNTIGRKQPIRKGKYSENSKAYLKTTKQ